jgi:AraC family transcriptional regulator
MRGTFERLKELQLVGIYVEVDSNSSAFQPTLRTAGDTFLREAQKVDCLTQDKLYTVVNCHEVDNGEYTVFYGMEGLADNQKSVFNTRLVPEGWYAKFIYRGDMFNIREAFIDDLYRWVMVKEIELNPNGVGMLNIYEKDYDATGHVQILVPVKAPK